jgi:hypothetical protein
MTRRSWRWERRYLLDIDSMTRNKGRADQMCGARCEGYSFFCVFLLVIVGWMDGNKDNDDDSGGE